MAIDEVNPSGASVAAESANEHAANSSQSAGTDKPVEEAAPTATPASDDSNVASANANDNNNAEPESEAMGDFSALLENYEKESAASKQEGEIIRGVVVGITEQYVLIDIGY